MFVTMNGHEEDRSVWCSVRIMSGVGRALTLSAALLWAWGWGAYTWAQRPGQLPSKTFSVDFQSAAGHIPDIQQVNLSGQPSIALEYDAATYVFAWPDHRSHQRPYWIKNIGTQRITDLLVWVKDHNGTVIPGSSQLYRGLDPGERLQISYMCGWGGFFPDDPCTECFYKYAGQEFQRNWTLTVSQCDSIAPDGTCADVAAPGATVPQNFTVRVQSVEQRPLNATVRGRVYDAVTNEPLFNPPAQVEVLNPSGQMGLPPFSLAVALSDRDPANPGNYSINVPEMTALVRCTMPGYQTHFEVATVAAGQTVTIDCPMERMPWTASYTLKTCIATNTGLWGWALTPDGSQVVLTPALSGNFTAEDAYAWMINLSAGSVAWRHHLGVQSAGPSISPNGRLVALPAQEALDTAGGAKVIILDAVDGSLLQSLMASTYFNPSSTAFSLDGAFLAVGGFGGEVWLIDTSDYSTVWFRQLAERQTRAVAWSRDGRTIYVSSDPSPIYAVNPADGTVRWHSYNTSFAYQDNIAQTADGSRIAVAAKYTGLVVLDKDGNDVFRRGPPEGQHAVIAAPDGAFFFSSAGFQNGAHLLDPTGKLFWWNNDTSEGAMLSGNAKLLLLGASLYELGGTRLWTDDAAAASGPHIAVMTPDKRHILTAGEDGMIYLFEGRVCTPTLSRTSVTVGPDGGPATVDVTVGTGCTWTATPNDAFITVASGAGGTGNGTVHFSIAANNGVGVRTGTITIAGWNFTVTEAGIPVNPQIKITPSALNFGYVPPGSYKDLTVEVKNIGMGTLIGTVSAAPPFICVSGERYSLGTNQTQKVVVRYTAPWQEGSQTGTLTFTGGGGFTIQVKGTNIKYVGLPWMQLLLGD